MDVLQHTGAAGNVAGSQLKGFSELGLLSARGFTSSEFTTLNYLQVGTCVCVCVQMHPAVDQHLVHNPDQKNEVAEK